MAYAAHMFVRNRTAWLFAPVLLVLWVAVAVKAAPQESHPEPTVSSAPERAIRFAVIGASTSAGFGCSALDVRADGRYGDAVDLARFVKVACSGRKCVVTDLASGYFFFSPIAQGRAQMDRALKSKADAVLAIDYLFWYAYGSDGPTGELLKDESERAAKLEIGLAQLARCECPMVIGDIPDMSRAVGKMLSQSQLPKRETLTLLNARIQDWAKGRKNVCVIPLDALSRDLRENGAITIDGTEWRAAKDEPLLQSDELHPTARGLAGLTAITLGSIEPLLPPALQSSCSRDPASILRALLASLPKLPEPRAKPLAPAPSTAQPSAPSVSPPANPPAKQAA